MNRFYVVILTVLMNFSFSALADDIDTGYKSKIADACVKSVESNGQQIKNHIFVCQCIGNTHYVFASKDPSKADAINRLKWTLDFYQETDMDRLQKMTDKNKAWSNFDDAVVTDCIRAAAKGKRK